MSASIPARVDQSARRLHAGPDGRLSAADAPHRLYVGASVLIAAIAFIGFTPSFWMPLSAGTLELHPTIYVHAALFFLWTLYFLAQTTLVARGRRAWHRGLGLFGIALAAWMVFSGILAAIVSLKAGLPGPRPDVARAAAALSFSGMILFTTFIALGVANVRRPELHRRLMVLAAFSIIQAAVARLIMLWPAIGQPLRIWIGAGIVDLLLLAVVLLDRRAVGRSIHPVWIAGFGLLVSMQCLRVAVARTELWASFTAWLAAL